MKKKVEMFKSFSKYNLDKLNQKNYIDNTNNIK